MESQPQNPEFRNNPENFHPCIMENIPVKLFKIWNSGSGEDILLTHINLASFLWDIGKQWRPRSD